MNHNEQQQTDPKLSKKIFRQWLIGAIIGDQEITIEGSTKAKKLADEILQFAEEHSLLNFGILL